MIRMEIGDATIELVFGDITLEETDAIVNAANSRLAGGGGVDGAIHRAGGPEIMAECRNIGSCPTGTAVITTAGELKAKRVIHTVGPVFRGGSRGEEGSLRGAYRSSLRLAAECGMKSVAFPSISTGAYGYPIELAARAALDEVIAFLRMDSRVRLVRFVLFSEADLTAYGEALKEVSAK